MGSAGRLGGLSVCNHGVGRGLHDLADATEGFKGPMLPPEPNAASRHGEMQRGREAKLGTAALPQKFFWKFPGARSL